MNVQTPSPSSDEMWKNLDNYVESATPEQLTAEVRKRSHLLRLEDQVWVQDGLDSEWKPRFIFHLPASVAFYQGDFSPEEGAWVVFKPETKTSGTAESPWPAAA